MLITLSLRAAISSLGAVSHRFNLSFLNPSTSVGFEPANLGSRAEYVTPRPQSPTSNALVPINLAYEAMNLSPITLPLVENKCN